MVKDKDGNTVAVGDDGKFTMPEGGVTVEVGFKEKQNNEYAIVISKVPHGVVSCEVQSAVEGSRIQLTALPDNGSHLDKLTVRTADGKIVVVNSDNSFVMSRSRVVITGRFVVDGSPHSGYWICK